MDEESVLKVYAPVLVAIVISLIQVIVVATHTSIEYNRRNRDDLTIGISPEKWIDESVCDDIICAIGSGCVLYGLCHMGATDWAWALLAPALALGCVSTTYYVVQAGINSAPAVH